MAGIAGEGGEGGEGEVGKRENNKQVQNQV